MVSGLRAEPKVSWIRNRAVPRSTATRGKTHGIRTPRCNSWSRHHTESTELSPSWETVSCSATHEISNILGNLNIHYYIHKILSQINLVPSLPSHLRPTLILFSHLCLGLPSSLFVGFSYKYFVCTALPFMLYALPISYLISSFQWYMARLQILYYLMLVLILI
jgi:hypothetical protein